MDKQLDGRVQSVDRAMLIMETLSEAEGGLRLTDLARRTKLSLTTVHRLLTTLEQRQFVQFLPSDNLWHIGLHTFSIGNAFVRDRSFVAPAQPFLRRLRDLTRETANLGIVDNGEIVLVDQLKSREITRSISRVGGRTPMTASGMGKSVLATYSGAEVSTFLTRYGMRRVTAKTLTCRDALATQLERIRTSGYAVDDEEYMPGLRCVAAPVYDLHSDVVCALSISGLPSRLVGDRLPALGQLVANAAAEMTRSIGGVAAPAMC
ncbi:MAG: IclR family transcriptional regulator C-terminal domain-containing protein [Candidatus Devosia phytovorans]|uniref:IclR family transcriptional regulator C-terminal domain-containing protein n=1 Tax=Candidatus Devosia phytovorans TaxID=3121372 RepID=A0AAJ5VTM7_9HYPH|nr:IclR family transcriptional regulator C-terminal domain-containing protein [Devosia sp.]WEK03392.1 MAG: IclR family transcriptional regulator C-terminal domain-containing protein [Devosia sp.]